MRYKKAQAAMEFLMTYGWAILVVLVAIGALAYFGVLNPGRYLPSSCTIGPGLACSEFKVTNVDTNSVDIYVRNGLGKSIGTVTMTLTPVGGSACSAGTTQDTSIADGGLGHFQFSCALASASKGDRFKGAISLGYIASGETLNHTMAGDITTRVE
ncbi:MAG: hypothetical protein KAU20_04610 [Nanoarchaeota archaeon]|nr:hypothetical protein [Nanoarchaeota archaeon]